MIEDPDQIRELFDATPVTLQACTPLLPQEIESDHENAEVELTANKEEATNTVTNMSDEIE